MKKMLLPSILTSSCGSEAAAEDARRSWTEFMTPGPEHTLLQSAGGTWDMENRFYIQPGAPPKTTRAVCVQKMILGQRFLYSTITGNMAGMPFEGIGISGYDKSRQVYILVWFDNMGTDIMYGEGRYDAPNKQVEIHLKNSDPGSGSLVPIRMTVKRPDADHMIQEMYTVHEEEEYRSLEMKYTRRK